ncbi:MAG TPA: ribose-5-phosphate isomerase RpiA [Kofleriaceae bacterium]
MNMEDAKRAAARAALDELPDEGIIGLGTGSTARYFIEALSELILLGKRYVGVPTSSASRKQARELGVPLLDDDGPWDIAVCVDGADEVDPELDVIKGRGGAHAREKIVNCAARKNVVLVDISKLSLRLGERAAVPVEVLAFAHATTAHHLTAFGDASLRVRDGVPVATDDGNLIYDLACGPIAEPDLLDHAIRSIPGVVETGLFIARVDVVLVASEFGVERRTSRRTFSGCERRDPHGAAEGYL